MEIRKNGEGADGFVRVEALATGTVFDVFGLPNNVQQGKYYLIKGGYDKAMFKALAGPKVKKEVSDGGTV